MEYNNDIKQTSFEHKIKTLTNSSNSRPLRNKKSRGHSITSSIESMKNEKDYFLPGKNVHTANFSPALQSLSKESKEFIQNICQKHTHLSQLSLADIIAYDFYQTLKSIKFRDGKEKKIIEDFFYCITRSKILCLYPNNKTPEFKDFFGDFQGYENSFQILFKNLTILEKEKISRQTHKLNQPKIQRAKSHFALIFEILKSPHRNALFVDPASKYTLSENVDKQCFLEYLSDYLAFLSHFWTAPTLAGSFGMEINFLKIINFIEKFDAKPKNAILSKFNHEILNIFVILCQSHLKLNLYSILTEKGQMNFAEYSQRERTLESSITEQEFPWYLLNKSTASSLLLNHCAIMLDLFSKFFLASHPNFISCDESCTKFMDSLEEYIEKTPLQEEPTHPISKEFSDDMKNLHKEIWETFPRLGKENSEFLSTRSIIDIAIQLEEPISLIPKIEQKISALLPKYQKKLEELQNGLSDADPQKIREEISSIFMSLLPLFGVLTHGDNILHLGYLFKNSSRFYGKVLELFEVFDPLKTLSEKILASSVEQKINSDEDIESELENLSLMENFKAEEILVKPNSILSENKKNEPTPHKKIPRGMKARKLRQWLHNEVNFSPNRQKGSHQTWKNDQGLPLLFCPHSGGKTFKRGTLKNIEKLANAHSQSNLD